MLILCYGITKSGSTLAFEMIKGMLKNAGHEQRRLADGVVKPGHRVNFVETMDPVVLARLRDAIPEHEKIAVKVHCNVNRPAYLQLQDLQEQGKVQIFASYRDPREICLSMVDAGAKARAANQQSFSEFVNVEAAMPEVEKQLAVFRRWASIRGTVRLSYNMVAFSPDLAIDVIERVLGITTNREFVMHHAFNRAFTQKNKGVKDRVSELTRAQDHHLRERFSEFLENVVLNNNEAWFSDFRTEFSQGGRARQTSTD